jgi:membrane dipeptidase
MLSYPGWDIGAPHASGTALGGDLDLPRMKEGGLAASFFAVFTAQGPRTPEGTAEARRQADEALDRLDAMFRKHPDLCERALTPDDAERIHRAGKRAIYLAMENGYPLGTDLSRLEAYYRRGVRYLTLCHASDNDLAASSTNSPSVSTSAMTGRTTPDPGLTPFGARVVARMNELGMMIDVSHISERALEDVLRLSRAPVLASHSNARALHDHPRNLTDGQIRAIAEKGGVIQVVLMSEFLKPTTPDPSGEKAYEDFWRRLDRHFTRKGVGEDPVIESAFEREYQDLKRKHPLFWASVKDLVDHIDHIVRIAGVDHVGIGTDFNGGGGLLDCQDVSQLPAITVELVRRGYTAPEIQKIWGDNVLRTFRRVLEIAGPGNPTRGPAPLANRISSR